MSKPDPFTKPEWQVILRTLYKDKQEKLYE